MKVVCVSVSMAEVKVIANAVAEPFARLAVEQIFGPMIQLPAKKVKKR